MEFALSTHWNAARHSSGEKMVEEILNLGFHRLELGYDLRLELVPGVQSMVRSGAVRVDSLHNFCPVPMGALRGHPEIWTMASREESDRESAIRHTMNTIRFAAEIGAKAVVVHAGYVDMPMISPQLFDLLAANQQFTPGYERLRMKLHTQRDKKAPRQFDHLLRGIERLLPLLEETGVVLALENLPTWEAYPTEIEFEEIKRRFPSPFVRYWHDLGHGQIRQNIGFINHERWVERLQPHMIGMHVHDVQPPASDHVMPPRGQIDFARFQRFGTSDILRVIEPTSRTPADEITEALAFLKKVWDTSKHN